METLKLSGNMVSISTKPEDAGHAEFARDLLAHNHKLEAINADLLAALKAMVSAQGFDQEAAAMIQASIAIAKAEEA